MIWLGLSYILIVRNLTWFELHYDFWEEKNYHRKEENDKP